MTRRPAPPLEWHPFYWDHTHLIEWLKPATYWPSGVDQYGSTVYEVPVLPRLGLELAEDVSCEEIRSITLTKHKAWGPAPWTGEPFAYAWFVATDNLGRSIAGESWTVPLEGEVER